MRNLFRENKVFKRDEPNMFRDCSGCGTKLEYWSFSEFNHEYENDDDVLDPIWKNKNKEIYCEKCFQKISKEKSRLYGKVYSYEFFFIYYHGYRPGFSKTKRSYYTCTKCSKEWDDCLYHELCPICEILQDKRE